MTVPEEPAATDPSTFWDRRHELSIRPTTRADVRERASGRHLVFLADVTDDAALSAFEPVLEDLDEFDCLDAWPPEHLHVTAKVVGTLAVGAAGLTADDERRFVEAADAALDGTEPFTVECPRLNLFPDGVNAEVDDGRVAELNDRLRAIEGMPAYDRDGDGFIPHVALARFTREAGADCVVAYLERNRALDSDPIEMSTITLVALDPSEWYPTFEAVKRHELG